MISIAICDDNSNESLFLECQIENCLGSRHIPYRKKVFSDGKNLLYEIADRTPFDIFVLEI